ncbi:hypothetical protein LSH36_732g01030 [Paralvinella palmiformis]|uniref:Uncharacterized protein n=1 Tax=Paralvinella palmiformis TaxID=53620 RepID=A0AAD9J1D2_9ANNE|nr:hypothetical protein LSH36_732g01030 [Paralvinella palmiformis]
MIFYPTTGRCYEVISKRKNWSESQQYCRSLYDQAHLMEIYDSKQQELFESMTQECRFTTRGTEYRGYRNRTISGRQCQSWTSQYPHSHDRLTYPNAWILEENYCRNIDDSIEPWCYTTDPDKRFDYCEIPYCSDFIETKPSSLSFGLWLGASKSVEGVDVIWSHTMKAVIGSNYSNLDYGESMGQASGINCLKSFRGQWSLAPCSKIKAFVCEY